ncbi:MAG TPA: hypothetical protein VK183_12010 [Flavobacterium sp.]|nr:hypothetical protein [Flavobacterium sp.]
MKTHPAHPALFLLILLLLQGSAIGQNPTVPFELDLGNAFRAKVPVFDPTTIRRDALFDAIRSIDSQFQSFNHDGYTLTLADAAQWQQLDEFTARAFPFLGFRERDFRVVETYLRDNYLVIQYSDHVKVSLEMRPIKNNTEISACFDVGFPVYSGQRVYLYVRINYYPDGNVKLIQYDYRPTGLPENILLYKYARDGRLIAQQKTDAFLDAEKAFAIATHQNQIALHSSFYRYVDTNYGVVWKITLKDGKDYYVADKTATAFDNQKLLVFDDEGYAQTYGQQPYAEIEKRTGKTVLIVSD